MKKILLLALCLAFAALSLDASDDSDRQFELAMGAFKSRNYGSAELLFKRIIDSGEDDYRDKAWFYHARSIFHQKKYKSAIYEFNSFVNQSRTASLSTESRFWMGESYYRLNEHVKAIEEYNRYITVGAGERYVPAAHDRIARIYFSQRRFDESIIEWNSAISKSKNRDSNAFRVYKIGEALFREKRYDESLRRLYPLLTSRTKQKTVARAQLLIGRIYQNMNNHGKAIAMFQSIPDSLLRESGISEAQYFQALSEIRLKDTRKALTLLDIFLLMGKESPWYYNGKYEMGRLLLSTADKNKGVEYLEDVRKSSAKEYLRVGATKILSFVYMKKDPSKAVPYLEEAVNTEDPERRKEVMLLLAEAYLKLHDFQKCEQVLGQLREKFPFDRDADQVLFLQARIHLEKGEMPLAAQSLEKMEREYPFSKYLVESKYFFAVAQGRLGKTKECAGLLNAYLKNQNVRYPYSANLLLFDSHMKLNDMKEAENVIARIITRYIDRPGVEKAVYEFAAALDSRGKSPWKYYNIIINRFPKSDTAVRMYGRIGENFFREKKYKESIVFYDKFLAANLKDGRGAVYYNRLQSLYQLNQYGEVIATLEKGNLPPMDESQWERIPLLASRSHFNLRHYDEVYNNFYIENLKKYENGDLFMFAKSAIEVGDAATAQEIVKSMPRESKHYDESLYILAGFYRKSGDLKLAGEYFAKMISNATQASAADRGRIELSELYIREKKYAEASELLAKVRDKAQLGEKDALTAINFFKSGELDKGVQYSQNNLYRIVSSEYGEEAIKLNLEHYYRTDNVQKFMQYADIMKQFKGSSEYLSYLSGKFYYKSKYYQNAISSFNRLANIDGPYAGEANYTLGTMSMLLYKNMPLALKHYQKAVESGGDDVYKWKSKINIAIIYDEMNDREKSLAVLKEVIDGVQRGDLLSQAKNLYEYLDMKNE